jgi:NAD(P)-dependent dehydrogenase (short-subunit alcohol dehydrogenase family)
MSGVIPLRRPGLPDEVAKAVEYVLSDGKSSYCSETKLRVAGGVVKSGVLFQKSLYFSKF